MPDKNEKSKETFPIVIIGAGIAGLCISFYLNKKNVPHIIIEKGKAGNTWIEERWDNFHLVNPNWAMKIPEFGFESDHFPSKDPNGFLNKKEIVNYLQSFARYLNSEIYENENVIKISKNNNSYEIQTSKRLIHTNTVIIATGAFGNPYIPEIHKNLDKDIFQIHSSKYKNSTGLPEGKVVVVGSGQSGAQIAEDLLDSGRKVILAVSKCGRRPRKYRSKDSSWWNYEMGLFDKTVNDVKLEERWKCSAHTSGAKGGHDINLIDLAENGLELCGSIKNCQGNKLFLKDNVYENVKFSDTYAINWRKNVDEFITKNNIKAPQESIKIDERIQSNILKNYDQILLNKEINSIIWATGFRYNFDWIDLDITDKNSHPIQYRGVTKYTGLYFMGLQWMYSSKSAQFIGVAEDAEYIVNDIVSKNLFS